MGRTDEAKLGRRVEPPPSKLHRINGYDAMVAMLQASLEVRDGQWVQGAPSHVFAEFMGALERRGFYLGVEDRYERLGRA